MALVDPKTPPRKDLERMCGGDQRLVKAFEKLFELIPSELNRGSDDVSSAQISADNASTQANFAGSFLTSFEYLINFMALQPAFAQIIDNSLGINPAQEQITSDYLYPIYQQFECSNPNFEIT